MIFIKRDYLVCEYILENIEIDNRDTRVEEEDLGDPALTNRTVSCFD